MCDQRNYTPRKLGTCTNSVYGLSFLLLTREPGSTTDRSHAHCMWASVNRISWLKTNQGASYTEYPSMQNTFQSNPSMHDRVSYRGGWNFPPPPPRNLEIEYVLSQVLNNNLVPDCVRSNLRGSKFKFFWGDMLPYPPNRHAHVIILLPSCFPPPTQNPI